MSKLPPITLCSINKNNNTNTNKGFSGRASSRSSKMVYRAFTTHKSLSSALMLNLHHVNEKQDPVLSNEIKKVVIRLNGSWGNKSTISLSQIIILDSDKNVMPIINHSVYPKEANRNSQFLFDKSNNKAEFKDCWSANITKEPIEITVECVCKKDFGYIVFFNSLCQEDTAAKNVEVYIDGYQAWAGNLMKDFVVMEKISLTPSLDTTRLSEPINIQKRRSLSMDEFGSIPQSSADTVTLKLLTNYGDLHKICISHVIFYDTNRYVIPIDEIEYTIVSGLLLSKSKDTLVENKNKMQTAENQLIFNYNQSNNPTIRYKLKTIKNISQMHIYSTCISTMENMCANHISVSLGDGMKKNLKMKKGTNDPAHQKHYKTVIYLNELA